MSNYARINKVDNGFTIQIYQNLRLEDDFKTVKDAEYVSSTLEEAIKIVEEKWLNG